MMKTGQDVEKLSSQHNHKVHWSELDEVEKEGRPAFMLMMSEIKLLGITGVRFFVSFFVIV
jgi:PHS family inorganic phosphate transporter-like MFS transporter